VGYADCGELLAELESKAHGLLLAGDYGDGVSLNDSLVSGCNVAERVEKSLLEITNRIGNSISV